MNGQADSMPGNQDVLIGPFLQRPAGPLAVDPTRNPAPSGGCVLAPPLSGHIQVSVASGGDAARGQTRLARTRSRCVYVGRIPGAVRIRIAGAGQHAGGLKAEPAVTACGFVPAAQGQVDAAVRAAHRATAKGGAIYARWRGDGAVHPCATPGVTAGDTMDRQGAPEEQSQGGAQRTCAKIGLNGGR